MGGGASEIGLGASFRGEKIPEGYLRKKRKKERYMKDAKKYKN